MKIGICTPWKVRCGIYSYTRDLAEALANLGEEVYIVRLPRFGRKTPELLQLVAAQFPKEADIFVISHEYGLYQNLEEVFYRELKTLHPKVPIVTICHAVGSWNIDRVVSEASNRVVVHNEFCAKRFDGPSVIIPHGCAPQNCFPTVEAKRSFGFKPEWPIVGYLGFISEYKGLEKLIEAMKGLPDAGLLIGGGWHVEADTTYISTLKQRSFEELPGRCQWLGYVEDRDLPRVYGAFDILCYCSRFATESGALLTALSYGKAVIASDLEPFRSKEKEGALVTFEDVEDLRMKIGMLIGNPELRAEFEEGARRYAESVSWPRVAELHRSLYEDVLSKV